jgi:hypothetical protein
LLIGGVHTPVFEQRETEMGFAVVETRLVDQRLQFDIAAVAVRGVRAPARPNSSLPAS